MRTKSTNTPMSWVRNQHTRHILHYRHQTEYRDEPSSRSRRVRRRAQRSLGNQILINLYRDQRDKGSDNSFLHQIDMAHHHSMASMSPSSGCQSAQTLQSLRCHQKSKRFRVRTPGWSAELYRYTLYKYNSYSLFFVSLLWTHYLTPEPALQRPTLTTQSKPLITNQIHT